MTPRTIRILTAGIASADAVLALGDKVVSLGLPGWVTSSWPFVLLGCYVFNQVAHAMLPQPGDEKK